MADTVRTYEIRISAVLDRSTSAAASDFVQQWEKAGKASNRQASEGARAQQRAAAEQARAVQHVAGIKDRFFASEQRAEEKKIREQVTAQEKATRYVAGIKERYFREQQRNEERAEQQAAQRAKRALDERRAQVRQIASDSMSNVAAVANKAMGIGKEIAGGLGVNFSVGSGISKAVQLQKMAVAIVNAGNRGATGEDRNGQVLALQEQARAIGNKYAFDPTKMLGGYAQFQAKTGDTATASAGLDRFAKLAKGMNVELDDMISMAGEVSSKLEDAFTPGEKRAQKVYEVLKRMTFQGQDFAIEIADLAKETARIGGGAGFFKGDIGDTIVKLSGLAQLARQSGGATSAADASRAVAAFVTTLKTPARRKALDDNGVEYKAADGSFLDPMTIIKNAIKATGGDTEKMNAMFKSSLGTKTVDPLLNAYRSGGGGDTGMAAVDKVIAKLSGTVSEGVIDENVNRAMGTMESKAQLFQNKIDTIAASLADRVLPAFERLAPTVEKAVKAFADVVAWASENPGRAITMAIVGSIAKASLGPMISKGITDMIAGGLNADGGAAAASKKLGPVTMAGGLASNLGAAFAIASIAVATFTVGSMIVDQLVDAKNKGETDRVNDDAKSMRADSIANGIIKTGEGTVAEKKELEDSISSLERRLQNAQNEKNQLIGGEFGAMLRAGENYVFGGPDKATLNKAQVDASTDENGVDHLAQLKEDLAAQHAKLDAINNGLLKGTIKITGKVEVTNAGDFNTGSNTGGTTGVPDHS